MKEQPLCDEIIIGTNVMIRNNININISINNFSNIKNSNIDISINISINFEQVTSTTVTLLTM